MDKKLHVVIPTKGRASWGQQVTLRALLEAARPVTLVVPMVEAPSYRDLLVDRGRGSFGGLVKIAKCPVDGIGQTRRWITRRLFRTERVLMLDDDMRFYTRPDMHSPKLEGAQPMDIRRMLLDIDIQLTDECPMVGISARQGNQNEEVPVKYNTRAMNAYAFDLAQMRKLGIKFGRMPIMEDFDITLRLLRAGYNNAVLYGYCWNQNSSNAKGGCSTYRTARMQAAAARQLKEFHPDYVTLVTKTTKSAWKGMQKRLDVRVAWAKAAKEKIDAVS